jgi:hypothetical protein
VEQVVVCRIISSRKIRFYEFTVRVDKGNFIFPGYGFQTFRKGFGAVFRRRIEPAVVG